MTLSGNNFCAPSQPMETSAEGILRSEPIETCNDAYAHEPRLRDLPKKVSNFPRIFFLLLIRGYQMTFARLLPSDTCRFYPSCSHYAYQYIYNHGALRGVPRAIWRVLRCNPFNPGGFDPVP